MRYISYLCLADRDRKQMDADKIQAKPGTGRERQIYQATIVGSVVNFVLLLFKFFAGIVGHSAAMLADAVHSLSDFVTDIIVLVFVRLSSKPEDASHDYGHGKYETLATAIIGVCLFLWGWVSCGTEPILFGSLFMVPRCPRQACWP